MHDVPCIGTFVTCRTYLCVIFLVLFVGITYEAVTNRLYYAPEFKKLKKGHSVTNCLISFEFNF